jgi:hypothetical protein
MCQKLRVLRKAKICCACTLHRSWKMQNCTGTFTLHAAPWFWMYWYDHTQQRVKHKYFNVIRRETEAYILLLHSLWTKWFPPSRILIIAVSLFLTCISQSATQFHKVSNRSSERCNMCHSPNSRIKKCTEWTENVWLHYAVFLTMISAKKQQILCTVKKT